jgi:hypothetical protein
VNLSLLSERYAHIITWSNLLSACHKAAKGKRGHAPAAAFEHQVADRLLALQAELAAFTYTPGAYVNFMIHDPKLRKISAAPFRDRVVHHALCNVIEPLFERQFIPDSYANRVGKGTHRAVDCLQACARQYRYVLRCDVRQFFPSIDHAILHNVLAQVIREDDVLWLCSRILASGAGVLTDEYEMVWFLGDDESAALRPRGLPIGNLTSQFWANCFLNPFDHFVIRELGCPAYLRYVDDFALFADDTRVLYRWKTAVIERLAALRLTIHEEAAQVVPCEQGIPWLGFVVYPDHRRVKARNVVKFTRRFRQRWADYCTGQISFGEFDASVQGWINHVRYADTWGLREHVVGRGLTYDRREHGTHRPPK